jgi:hypothetical protein|tara:strand:- start:17792 stop:17911 length:120 start_codon:yes stop_codon:yes gene_type:complete
MKKENMHKPFYEIIASIAKVYKCRITSKIEDNNNAIKSA